MFKPTLSAAAFAAIVLASCTPPPPSPPPERYQPNPENALRSDGQAPDPYARSTDPNGGQPDPYGGNSDAYGSNPGNGSNNAANGSSSAPGEYPTARKTTRPNEVLSPYPPFNVIDIEGFKTGQLARDPSNQKIFRVP